MAMPMVIIIVTAAVSSIAYLMVTLIPQLQDEQKKSQDIINYRIFVSSLNDYLVHAMREKWCVNKISYSSNVLESDLLLSNDCSSTATMKQIVTFEGNLERLLWTDDTIGKDLNPEKNTIIGLNNARRADNTITPQPPLITNSEVSLSSLKIKLSQNVLQNMTDVHPLFTMTRNIRNCLESVDIEIKRLSSDSVGDEVKIQIYILGNISQTKLSCLQSVQTLTSTINYTFFPRRLHTYSLIKYGHLDANKYHEYHGPVYAAGNLILPPDGFDKSKSSIFYNSLTLGIYNDGSGVLESGKVKLNTGEDYTFDDRGHPYLSKQDSYTNFRGILGGLRLDASEDKGMANIFNPGGAATADVATLEACIEENQVKTKPSYTAGTKLVYKNPSPSSNGSMSFRIGLSSKNRFKPSLNAPQEFNAIENENTQKKFNLTVTSTNGTRSIGEFEVDINNDNKFQFTIAPGSPSDLVVDYEKFQLTNTHLDPAITTLNGVITKDNHNTILPSGHILTDIDEYNQFQTRVATFKGLCDTVATAECDDFLIPNNCPAPCSLDYSAAKSQMLNARDALRNKINEIKGQVSTPAKVHFEINNFNNGSGEMIINQKDVSINFSSNWGYVIDLIESSLPNKMRIKFTPYHYSYDDIKAKFIHRLNNTSSDLQIVRQDTNNDTNFNNSGWRDSFDNSNVPVDQEPEDLFELDCPDGMSLADWNQDMSATTNFSWNYANTPPGAIIEGNDHGNLGNLPFTSAEGNSKSNTKSVVTNCIIPNNREFVFGFYVCQNLIINPGRVKDLYLIGTFIVNNIVNNNSTARVIWHSIWDTKAAGLILNKYFEDQPICQALIGKTWKDIIGSDDLKERVKACSAMDLVTNGPNNFTWTTVDPDIGLIAGNTMTSQKVLRFQRWVIREDSRQDLVR